jgi:hypothetical protein
MNGKADGSLGNLQVKTIIFIIYPVLQGRDKK